MNYTITANPAFNSLEITFDGKPAQEVRDALKALKFRWHAEKKCWYGYSDENTVRAAIDGGDTWKDLDGAANAPAGKKWQSNGKSRFSGEYKHRLVDKQEEQNHVKIYWNGIKIDGGKLIKCGYSMDNNADNAPSVSIYARDYVSLPRDLFEVKNDSDIYTDYFENDHAYLTPEHPLYKYFRYAAAKAKIRELKSYIAYHEKSLASPELFTGRHDFDRKEIEQSRERLAELEKIADPGQPTAADIAEIDRQRQEAENAKQQAQHDEELRQRELYNAQRVNGQHLISREIEAHPVKEGEPSVLVNWSEHPAFYDYADNSLTLSVTAAENILSALDTEQNETRETENGIGWYYKTKFTVKWTDENGEECTYTGRYDLGDGDGGFISHIRGIGTWYLTHDNYGHEKAQPDETNEIVEFADFLSQFVEK